MALTFPRQRADWQRSAGLIGLVVLAGTICGAIATVAGPVYAVAGVVAALAGLVVAAKTRLTMLAFIGVATLLPFGVIPVPIGGVRLTFIDATLSLLLVTWLARLLTRREGEIVGTPVDGPLLAFIGLAIASFVFGTAYAMTAEVARQFLKLVNSMLFFFTIAQIVRTRRDLILLLRALAIGGAIAALIGIALYYLRPETASSLLRSLRPLGYPGGEVLRYVEDGGVRTKTLRAIGTSVDPNVFGALLLITGGLTLGQIPTATAQARRWLIPALGVIGYALLISLSRGSWVGFSVAFGVMALARYRRLLLLLPALVIPGALVFSAQVGRFVEHFLKAVYAQDQATGMRLGEYKDALNLIQQNPWLGIGFGGAPSRDLYLGVSSTYLLIGEEMGLIGLAVFLALLGMIIATGVRAYRSAPEPTRPLVLALLATFCGVVVAATFDHHFFNLRYQHVSALFWLLAALTVRAGALRDTPEPAAPEPDFVPAGHPDQVRSGT